MSVGWSVRWGTEFEFLALRPFSLSKLALIDADEDDNEEYDDGEEDDDDDDDDDDDEYDDEEDDEEKDEKDDMFQKNIFSIFLFFSNFSFFLD